MHRIAAAVPAFIRRVIAGITGGTLCLPLYGYAQRLPEPPSPLADDVFYQIMPIAWRDSDDDPLRYGDFDGMTASLDYLQRLGVTAIWTTPIFPSPAYHGYQHLDADKLNPRFGTEEQFRRFLREAHRRGMKVFIDFVAYGIGHESTYFSDAHKNPASDYSSWLAFKDPANESYQGHTFRTWNGSEVGFVHWNLNMPGPRNLVIDWARKWLDPDGDGDPSDGVDGYRLDHVWYQYNNGVDDWGYTINGFWNPWKNALRKVNPKVITIAEQADWESTGENLLSAFDAAFTKPLSFAIRRSLREGDADPIYRAMHAALRSIRAANHEITDEQGTRTYLAIVGDHDVDRLASDIEPSKQPDPLMRRPALAAVMLMTQPFPPVVYMGDEIGMIGVRRQGNTDANDIPVREPFKWNAVAGPPMSDYWQAHQPSVREAFSRDRDGRSVEEQDKKAGSLLETYRALIALRRAHPVLRIGSYTALRCNEPGVWIFLRQASDETILVCVNLAEAPVSLTMPTPRQIGRWNAWTPTPLFELTPPGAAAPSFDTVVTPGALTLPGLGAGVYRLDRRSDVK